MADTALVGVIGVGKMGSALVEGMAGGAWDPGDLMVYDVREEATESLRKRVGEQLKVASSVADLHQQTDLLLLCVKPGVVSRALSPLNDREVRLVSIAAGVTIENLRRHVGENSRIIRVMPNTPAQVGCGMSFVAPGPGVTDEFLGEATRILGAVGEVIVVDESKMDAATALSGSGPAYVFYFLEALQEAGIYLGFDAETALTAALQTLRGSARLAEEKEASPARLRQDVSSPGGTTVEALKHLDESGVKGQIEEAVRRACEKSRALRMD